MNTGEPMLKSLSKMAGGSLLAATMLAGPVTAAAADTADLIEKAMNGSHRSATYKARNQYRHPTATLLFFGLKPDMTVVEITPGGGWYSEILAPVLRDNGMFYAASYRITAKVLQPWFYSLCISKLHFVG